MTENDKQERIIAAAYKVLAERGYDEASTKEIARAAGVAQGLIGYYFSSKDLLFAEVFRRESERYCESLPFVRRHGEQPLDLGSLKSALSVPKSRAEDNPSWIKLRYELFALGLRNPAVSDSIKDTLASKRAHLTELIETVSKLPEEQSRALAPILLSVFDGLALQRLCDKEFDYDGAYDTLAAMIHAYLQTLQK
ncbi:TetR/AcrR family transcriptional regulator [Paenibacillus arenilitoris]|uniref:TetR/AcrR family transcriptional regulator n=1 Tax=Paenibacillus arenilitoris TaxID=2772299 RepID=A0A927H6U8_9BACL|nr:TetR/AcrR family transcriptional regulator [Paenibacillus arenilitoris]MBD2869867.1 TetR/AcrR family transcriptional regulator [Paenibacillus arenilitoris]